MYFGQELIKKITIIMTNKIVETITRKKNVANDIKSTSRKTIL